MDPERELRIQQRQAKDPQVISPQNAYIMSRMLQKTVEEGTLAHGAGWGAKFTFRDENGKSFRMPVAGKTGTPQNWSDAWAVGYSPYYTTAIWFGFDKPGNSLGVDLTGSTLAGPVWGDYIREIHQGLPRRDFARPAADIIDVTVCAKSGLLKTSACNQGEVTLPFLAGTQPTHACDIHINNRPSYARSPIPGFDDDLISDLPMPILSAELFPAAPANNRNNRNTANRRNTAQNRNPPRGNSNQNPPLNNPLLDGDTDIRFEPENFSQPESAQENLSAETAAAENNNEGPPVQQDIFNFEPQHITQDSDPGPGLEIPAYNPLLD
jgi:penicillin-binding protein 1A